MKRKKFKIIYYFLNVAYRSVCAYDRTFRSRSFVRRSCVRFHDQMKNRMMYFFFFSLYVETTTHLYCGLSGLIPHCLGPAHKPRDLQNSAQEFFIVFLNWNKDDFVCPGNPNFSVRSPVREGTHTLWKVSLLGVKKLQINGSRSQEFTVGVYGFIICLFD